MVACVPYCLACWPPAAVLGTVWLWPMAGQDLRPINRHVSELGRELSPDELSDEATALADTLMAMSQKTLNQGTQLRCAHIPDP